MKNYLIWKLFALYNYWCRWRLFRALPGIAREIEDYSRKSDTTGTKYATLWRAVSIILAERPATILECGTGLSTIVLGAAVKQLRARFPDYRGRIVSMESMEVWYNIARQNLPEKYADVVELVLGPRQKDEFLFFAATGTRISRPWILTLFSWTGRTTPTSRVEPFAPMSSMWWRLPQRLSSGASLTPGFPPFTSCKRCLAPVRSAITRLPVPPISAFPANRSG